LLLIGSRISFERASRLYLKNLVAKVTSEQVMERKTINIRLCMSKQLKRKWKIMCQLIEMPV
jgi:hypothetical protein